LGRQSPTGSETGVLESFAGIASWVTGYVFVGEIIAVSISVGGKAGFGTPSVGSTTIEGYRPHIIKSVAIDGVAVKGRDTLVIGTVAHGLSPVGLGFDRIGFLAS